MRIFKNKWFGRFAKQQEITDEDLKDAVRRANDGRIDADLGGGVIKQRIARPGEGRSGGFRSIILFRKEDKAFFVYGFPKSDRDNIERDELKAYKKLAGEMLEYDDAALAKALKGGALTEVEDNDDDEEEVDEEDGQGA